MTDFIGLGLVCIAFLIVMSIPIRMYRKSRRKRLRGKVDVFEFIASLPKRDPND
jgi:hypothetical protein